MAGNEEGGRRSLRPRRRWLRYALPFSAVVVLAAGGGFAALESDTVESFWEGVWWALSLMTTVGLVGTEPLTVGGRLLSAVLMVMGFALLAMTTAAVASLFVREDEAPEERALRAFEASVLAELRDVRDRLERLESRFPNS
jgi:voltage-gated potassium channel